MHSYVHMYIYIYLPNIPPLCPSRHKYIDTYAHTYVCVNAPYTHWPIKRGTHRKITTAMMILMVVMPPTQKATTTTITIRTTAISSN